MKIVSPPADHEPFDRNLMCQEALEDAFCTIVEAAKSAGWDEEETLVALADLSDHRMLAKSHFDALDSLLRKLRSKS